MLLSKVLKKRKSLTSKQYWYITKQDLYIPSLCKTIKEFFRGSINTEENPNYRKLNNAFWYGLLCKTEGREYKDSILSKVFIEIENITKGNFDNVDIYKEIMVNQVEKVFIWNKIVDGRTQERRDFKIHPIMFTYKIILMVGDTLGEYSISLDEFKAFLATSKRYEEFIETYLLIRENRIKENFIEIFKNNFISHVDFEETRFNRILENIYYFDTSRSQISIKDEYINIVRKKVYMYETLLYDLRKENEIFSIEFLCSLSSFESLYNQYTFKEKNKNLTLLPKNNIKGYNKIIYGAPGTGKSFKIDQITENKKVFRTTFHPEYDYYNFVGGFKPITENKEIEYKFIPQVFLKAYEYAWEHMDEEEIYLVIEEINRGNCASIFGDIFQLLDRDESGFSKYSIDINEEMKYYLLNKFKDFTHSAIQEGKIKLPNNLIILATMNTSDQSLFPMDSAFKRRWIWEHIPINYNDEKSAFIINIGGNKFEWLDFIKKVNKKILDVTGSSDKQLGNWFVKPLNGKIIDEELFVNKVLFYLWNDVFKDEEENIFIVDDEYIVFEDLFNTETSTIDSDKVIKILKNLEINKLNENSSIESL